MAGLCKRKKWGIVLIVWPFAALILSFVIFALTNWVLGSMATVETPTTPSTPTSGGIAEGLDSASGELFESSGSVFETVVNVILFIVGAAAVGLGLPSVIVGIVLLATSAGDAPIARKMPRQEKKGLSIASMVLGICSIVLWFIGFVPAVLAVIFGGIGLKRGVGKGFAIAGLVTGIVGLVVSAIFFLAMVVTTYNGITQRAKDASIGVDASNVVKKALLYYSDNNEYPTYLLMERLLDGTGVEIGQQGSAGDIVYIPCYGRGAIVWYWSSQESDYKTLYTGDTSICEWN